MVWLVTPSSIGFAGLVPSAYRVAPLFLIRVAGVPFDVIERFATPETISVARKLAARKKDYAEARSEVESLLRSREQRLSAEAFRALRKAVRSERAPVGVTGIQSPVFTNYADAAANVSAVESKLDAALARELGVARTALWGSARKVLPLYAVFATAGLSDRLSIFLAERTNRRGTLGRRNTRARERDRLLLLYLQRMAAKNDTLSEFGPTGWGSIESEIDGLRLAPEPGVAKREAFLERWTAHAVAAAMNADAEIQPELCPRLNPNGRIDNGRFVFAHTGETIAFNEATLRIIKRCDGRTPVHSLGMAIEPVRGLIEKKVLRCEMEVPALEPHAFNVLRDDVETWRTGKARERWLSILQPIAELPNKFASAIGAKERQQILDEARSRLQSVGAARKEGERFLYSATNAIGEECFRACNFRISDDVINQVAVDAAPWIDLWRDSYAFIASRVAAGLRQVFEKAGPKNGAIPLPAFLRACEMAELPLTNSGLVSLAAIAFQEVKIAFCERLRTHVDPEEYELTVDDCHVVRENFNYPKFDEYTYPSADLQISAPSSAAIALGEYQWILAELHPPIALLQHCMYWSCPDKPALGRLLATTMGGRPHFHFGFSAADFTAHTAVRWFDALPEISNFVASERGDPNWRTVRPADAEVYLDKTTEDIGLRKIGSHDYLGSFARAWIIPLGFHPFQFGLAPHMPRLRCGKVIVQRRSWTVMREELPAGDYTGISRDLVLGLERLRALKDWPRHIYIRPTEQALRRGGAEGRDKDTKPVFIDLESYLFLEIFYRWLTKWSELEVTEMLPDPDHLLWREADGRRTFELRTLIVPCS